MRISRISSQTLGLLVVLSGHAWAQGPTDGAQAATVVPPVTPDASATLVAPKLKDHSDPVYPPGAVKDRIIATVGLELSVDETGHVLVAKVIQPAGRGFDEAALAAVKNWTFEPALQNGRPIKATVQLTLPFEPPSLVPVPAVANTAASPTPLPQNTAPPAEQ